MWCFLPPARPGSTACRPPAPLWPMEAHLSSGVTAQSVAETQKTISTFKAPWLIYKHAYSCKVCVFVCSQRTSMLTWLLEPLEIWATELLEVGEGVRKINKLLEDGVKHLQFVLCTDRHIFRRNCNKTPRTVCRGVCVFMSTMCKLTTVEHCFHIKTVRQEQIGLPFEGLRRR